MTGKIAVVTGASRGIGRGIAIGLAEDGMTVYISGRTLEGKLSLNEVVEEGKKRGVKGRLVPVQCDHTDGDNIAKLFKTIKDKEGRLDVLVNNCYAAAEYVAKSMHLKFYEKPVDTWDKVNNVGLRAHYYATWHAAQIMVPQKSGLIVNISSVGGGYFLFDVAYGIGKAALDRMAFDTHVQLHKHNICVVSLWPGAVRTEMVQDLLENAPKGSKVAQNFQVSESPLYAGRAIAALAKDPKVSARSGTIVTTGSLANEYGFTDVDGTQPPALVEPLHQWSRL